MAEGCGTERCPAALVCQGARRWNAFAARYRAELRQRPELLRLLHELRRRGPLTLLHGMRDASRNHALVVRELLEEDKDNEP